MDENTINDMMTFSDMVAQTESLKPLMDLIEQIMAIPESTLNNDSVEMMSGMLSGGFTPAVKEKSITNLVQDFEEQGFSKQMVINTVNELKNGINEIISDLKPSAAKEKLLDSVFGCFYEIFDGVIERFHTFSITLPFKLDEGAQVPTYAHESDACADVYASQDALIKAHTVSNLVHTGIHIALPEGWQARLAPRSSIGAKTPIRISNGIPIIDTGYRGEIMLFFDNNSDSDYQIKAGDRVAQMWIEPIYRFKAEVMDELPEAAERNNNGIGSTGK